MAEIMAPVGAQEQLLAAVRCGADAVYLGGKGFNARRNAANFDALDLAEAVKYCHQRGVRVYVTVNTVITDSEREELEREADYIAAAGADAVIIQDMATLRLFREKYPTIERYASTQTAVHNVDGAKYLESCGFHSIVLARELSLAEMEKICAATPLKAEAFVHGAHCMSLSGGCYLSAMLGGRSGNRGLCAQPCRLDWHCGGGDHVLSLKDMSLISHLREMINAGVTTLKIEGRMKRPEYVAAAVTACKNALEGKPYDLKTLEAVFSRSGFTDGYLMGKRDKSMFGYRTRDDVTAADNVLKSLAETYKNENPIIPVNMHFDLNADGGVLSISDGKNDVDIKAPTPEKAINRPLDEQGARKSLEKCGGTPYFVEEFSAEIEQGLMLSASSLNALRREGLEKLSELRGKKPEHKAHPFAWEKRGAFPLKRMRPALWARFYKARQVAGGEYLEKIILPLGEIGGSIIEKYGEKLVAQLPTLLFPDDETRLEQRLKEHKALGLKAVWTNNIYGIALGKRLGLDIHGGFGLNVLNTESLVHYEKDGLCSLTLSFELAAAKIRDLGGSLPRGVVAYGSLPLMHFRNCPVKAFSGCEKCGEKGALTDRTGTVFPVECGEKRYSTLLNSIELDIADKEISGIDYNLLYFTRESAVDAKRVIERFVKAEKADKPHTGGLYFRKLL
ncbi:MAG: U32 family peptidase [Clostridia bacterium]|nr:U32 family peptidase [Clostridia bacterium]